MGPGTQRPSHFDRIDDKTAHCVSGQNLSPGDYPVGVAIPHPKQPGYFFHLVNLTTPRHKLAYGYVTQNAEKKRLTDISRRTFDRLLALRRPLDPADLPVFAVLDPRELSRFAGRFFEVVDDQPLSEKARENLPTWQPVGPPGPRRPTGRVWARRIPRAGSSASTGVCASCWRPTGRGRRRRACSRPLRQNGSCRPRLPPRKSWSGSRRWRLPSATLGLKPTPGSAASWETPTRSSSSRRQPRNSAPPRPRSCWMPPRGARTIRHLARR